TPDEEPIQTTVAIASTDGEGRFTVTFTYPVDPIWREPGTIEVVAYALDNGARAVAPFEVLESAPPSEEDVADVTPTATAVQEPTATLTPLPTSAASGQPTPTQTPT